MEENMSIVDAMTNLSQTSMVSANQLREFQEIVKRLTLLQADVDRINAFSKQQYVIEEMEP